MNANDIFSNKVVQTASIGVASFAAGGVLGYFIGKRSKAQEVSEEPASLTFMYETIDEDNETVTYEVTELTDEFSEEDEQPPTIEIPSSDEDEDISEPSNERNIEWLGPDPRDEIPVPQEYVHISNVFDVNDDDWDHEAELKKREESDGPYILHITEFMENDSDYPQISLTYYTEDEVVVDDDDKPVYNYHDVLGIDNLRFGHGSTQDGVVYIRNEKRKADFEVLKFEGHYATERLGLRMDEELEDELRHAEPRRFRMNE